MPVCLICVDCFVFLALMVKIRHRFNKSQANAAQDVRLYDVLVENLEFKHQQGLQKLKAARGPNGTMYLSHYYDFPQGFLAKAMVTVLQCIF